MTLNKGESRFRVSIVLPTYNEKDNVPIIVERLSKCLGNSLWEFVIVDDDSPDLTWKVAQDLKNPKIKVIRRVNEKGLASALWRGITESTGNVVVWMDCDLGLPPEDVPNLVEQLDKYDVSIGSRYVKGGGDPRGPFRSSLSIILNLFAGTLLGFGVRDYTSGFAAVRKEVFNKVKFSPEGFGEYFIEFAYSLAYLVASACLLLSCSANFG